MKKGQKKKKYSPEFKIGVILDMHSHRLGYRETVRKHWEDSKGKEPNHIKQVQRWERIYLEEGAEGLMKELVMSTGYGKVDHQNLIKVLKEI